MPYQISIFVFYDIFSWNQDYPWYFQTTSYDSSNNIAYHILGPGHALCPRFLTNNMDVYENTPQVGGVVITCTVGKHYGIISLKLQ